MLIAFLYFLLTREHIGTGTPRISVCRQDGPGPCYQNNAMSYRHIESISVLKCVHEERESPGESGGEHGGVPWLLKTHAEIGCFETSVKINTLSLAPNRVIRETELDLQLINIIYVNCGVRKSDSKSW